MRTNIDSSSSIRVFGRYLRDSGLPITHQREVVADIVFGSEGHLSVDDIERSLRERKERIGKATIYRTFRAPRVPALGSCFSYAGES